MIDILMATYNGERYISEQIESILNQTYKNWKLYIRDDGSKDNTISIIRDFEKQYPNKIILVKDKKNGLGAKCNFAELMKYSKQEYCMFSDQDDIWIDNKIEKTLEKMKQAEKKYSKKTPILVHTDLKVVDVELNVINDSFWKYQNLNQNAIQMNELLVQNNVTGCTMMLNKSLLDLSKDIPSKCIMHDWWIALVASCFGKIETLNESTILYRQHGNNEVGAHKYRSLDFIKSKIKNINKIKNRINATILQGNEFRNIFSNILNDKNKYIIDEFCELKNKNTIYKKISVIKNKFYKNGLVRNIAYLIFI